MSSTTNGTLSQKAIIAAGIGPTPGFIGNRKVIGVPVSAVVSERDDDAGLYPPQMFYNSGDNLNLFLVSGPFVIRVHSSKRCSRTRARADRAEVGEKPAKVDVPFEDSLSETLRAMDRG